MLRPEQPADGQWQRFCTMYGTVYGTVPLSQTPKPLPGTGSRWAHPTMVKET